MMRFFEFHAAGDDEIVLADDSPQGLDEKLCLVAQNSVGAYARRGRGTYRRWVESFSNHRMSADEEPRTFLTEHHEAVRRRAIDWARKHLALIMKPAVNVQHGTWTIDRDDGPVNHKARAFPTLRRFYRDAIRAGLRGDDRQNPFEKDGWHEESEASKMEYCVDLYGTEAARAFKNAGGQFLVLERTVYAPSLFDPTGIGARMAAAMRERLGDHVACNVMDLIHDDPSRFHDIIDADAEDWLVSDFGDTFLARSKGKGEKRCKPQVMGAATLVNLHRRIDLDHAADPSRPNMRTLHAWRDAGEWERLKGFKILQKHPSQGSGPPSYDAFHELLEKACRASNVTIGWGSGAKLATSRWPRREKVDGRMLELHRTSATPEEYARGKDLLIGEMHWATDQTPAYGSRAAFVVAQEGKRADTERRAARRAAEAAGAMPAPPPRAMSPAAAAAFATGMRRIP